MARLTPQQVSEKWARNLGASVTDIQNGVNAVTESPTEKAAQREQKMLQGITQAVQSGKWAAGLRRVSLAQWKAAVISKGIPRIAGGASAAVPKMTGFMQELLPFQDNLRGTIESMPDLTLEDNIQRMVSWTRGMAQFTRR